MSFLDSVRRAEALLREQGRISLRALQRELDLDGDAVDVLTEELIEVRRVAARDGKVLVWAGAINARGSGEEQGNVTPFASSLNDGERRHLTVLFCDLVGSTELASRMDPEDWRAVTTAYLRAATDVVERFGGHVAKYLGDGLLVYFGYPQAHEDDGERAVRAGLTIVAAVQALDDPSGPAHSERAGSGRTPTACALRIRVGIHAGLTVIGDGSQRAEVFGENVNLASRIQSVAAPNTVVISSALLRLIRGIFVIEDLGARRLKGFADPVSLYRVVQPSGVRSRLDLAAGKLTLFVGRQSDLGTLLDAWERVLDGTGQTVLVHGEPGVGKSRLVYELRKRLGTAPHTWLEGRCSPYTQGTAFYPVIDLLTQGLRLSPEDTSAEKLTKLERALERVGFSLAETVPLFADFLSIPCGGYAPLGLHPDVQRLKTLAALSEWNLRLGALQPLIMLMEDLHWCDPSSQELLGLLVEQSPTARVLLVCTARPEFQSRWAPRSNLTAVTLGRLTRHQAREMAVAVGRTLSAEAVDAIVARADGVPLYVEELAKAVLESETPEAEVPTPATLQDSLMARLDRQSAAKEVAQRAAVLGREFSYRLLEATAGLDRGALTRGLGQLVEAELLFVRGTPPDATYVFKHTLIQETAYQSLLKRTRQELHARVVRALEERPAGHQEVVARHCEAAGLVDEAIAHYQLASEAAQTRSAHEEAIVHLRKAIRLVAALGEGPVQGAREARLQLMLGPSLIAARGYAHEETGIAWERARTLAEAGGLLPELTDALIGLAILAETRGYPAQAVDIGERILTLAKRTGDEVHLIVGYGMMGDASYWQGKFEASLEHYQRGFSIYSPARHGHLAFRFGTDQGATPRSFAAWTLWQLGYPERAYRQSLEAVELARAHGHPFSLALALFYQTMLYWYRGDVVRQRSGAEEVLALGEQYDFPTWRGVSKVWHAAAQITAGRGDTVHGELTDGMALLAGTGQQCTAPVIMQIAAEVHAATGCYPEALNLVESGLAVGAQTGQHFHDADLHRLKGELLRVTQPDGVAEAESLFRRALEIARAQQARSFELRAATNLARLLHDRGRLSEASAELAPVYGWFTEGFDTQNLKDARALLEELST
jgi:class 3 adenylate cyclase/predicted ATPase